MSTRWVIVGLLVSAVGGWAHNSLEGFAFLSGEMVMTLIPALVLILGWLVVPGRGMWWATLIWVGMNLVVGAVLSVLPLPIWPFTPDQSTGHYMSHLLYAVTQLPALYALWLTRPARVSA